MTVEVGGWDHGCCGPAFARNQLVNLGCIRSTGPGGQAVFSEVRHNVDPQAWVRGRGVDLLVARPDGTSQAIHRVPSGAELTLLDHEEVVLLQEAWTLTPVDAGTEVSGGRGGRQQTRVFLISTREEAHDAVFSDDLDRR